jgi:hypothetical protein
MVLKFGHFGKHQKCFESFEMERWRRMEKIILADRVLCKVKKERNITLTIKRRKDNWIGHTLLKNCLLKHVTERNIQGTGRRGRRHKQILDDIKEMRRHCNLKEEALDRTGWRIFLD